MSEGTFTVFYTLVMHGKLSKIGQVKGKICGPNLKRFQNFRNQLKVSESNSNHICLMGLGVIADGTRIRIWDLACFYPRIWIGFG